MENQNQQMEMVASLPIGVRYNVGITEGAEGHRNLSRFNAENPSTFTGSNNNVVRIPVSSGMFLDLKNAVLGYDFKNVSTSTGSPAPSTQVTLDGSAGCVIQRLRILSNNGNEIERIDQYGQLSAVFDQYAGNLSSLVSGHALDGGARRISYTTKLPSLALDQTTKTGTLADGTNVEIGTVTGLELTIDNANGGKGYMPEEADDLDVNVQRHYELGLKNGFFNPSTAKMLPPNVSFVLELTLAPPANCLKSSASVPAYEATNFILSIPSVQILDPNAMARLNARLARGVSWKCNTFHHHINTINSGAGPASLQIGERSRVLKGLMTVFRFQADVADKTKFKLSKRTIQHLDNYQYQIGSTQYPSNQIDINCSDTKTAGGTGATVRLVGAGDNCNVSEAYSEVLRVFGGLNANVGTCVVGAEPFAQSTLANGAGLIAVDLQAYSDGSVTSGLDTASNSLPVMLNIQKNAVANAIMQADTYSISEMSIMIDEFGQLFSES